MIETTPCPMVLINCKTKDVKFSEISCPLFKIFNGTPLKILVNCIGSLPPESIINKIHGIPKNSYNKSKIIMVNILGIQIKVY